VAARSKVRTVFDRLNTGIMGSKPARGMDVCPRFSVLVGSGLATGRFSVQGVLPTVNRFISFRSQILDRTRPEGLIRIIIIIIIFIVLFSHFFPSAYDTKRQMG
jgi:hypothetical protein